MSIWSPKVVETHLMLASSLNFFATSRYLAGSASMPTNATFSNPSFEGSTTREYCFIMPLSSRFPTLFLIVDSARSSLSAMAEKWVLEFLEKDRVYLHPGYFFDFSANQIGGSAVSLGGEEEAYIVISLLPPCPIFKEGISRILARVKNK